MNAPPAALEVRDLSVRFGGVVALDGVSLTIRAGARHGILGPNGSGKTTLFNAISGFVRPQDGRLLLAGVDITRLAAHRRARLGLARTFQITSLFPSLRVDQNVAMAGRIPAGAEGQAWRAAADFTTVNERAAALLYSLGLAHLAKREVRSLGYGEQRQLEIAVALALDPQVLLLDEPTAGLSAAETHALVALVERLPTNLSVVLIEHDLGVVFGLTEHLSVLLNGVLIADGPTAAVRQDAAVQEAYLGR